MGAFKYCIECDHPLSKPTPREDLIDGQVCPGCGKVEKDYMTIAEWIVEAFEEIELLKE